MKKLVATLTLSAAALLAGCSQPQPAYYPPPPAIDFQAVQQQGFHDGFDAARNDVSSNRPPRFDHHPRYRRPPVAPPAIEAYRRAFRDGYERFLHQGPPPPPAY